MGGRRGRSGAEKDEAGRLVVDGAELAEFARQHAAAPPDPSGIGRSARNRFVGLVTRVVADGVMAQVEMQCGPNSVVSLMSAESARELGLEPGGSPSPSSRPPPSSSRPRAEPHERLAVPRDVGGDAASPAAGMLAARRRRQAGSPGSSRRAAPKATTLTVFAAASLQKTFTTLGQQFEQQHPGTKVDVQLRRLLRPGHPDHQRRAGRRLRQRRSRRT